MVPVKSAAGLQVLKDRSVALSPRQRAAFILVDGKRSVQELLAHAAGAVSAEDIDRLFELGLVDEYAPLQPAANQR